MIINTVKLLEGISTKKYPVYITLFSNDTTLGKIIRKSIKQDYTHATISFDASLNDMYSFSSIPFNRGISGDGFVRESLWSPMYSTNRYFDVYVVYVTEASYKLMQQKVDSFVREYTQFKYNTLGLIKYYLNFKERNDYSEKHKRLWFCSEFVSYILNSGEERMFDNLMQSPGDLKDYEHIKFIKRYTLDSFNENDLLQTTKNIQRMSLKEEFSPELGFDVEDDREIEELTEGFIRDYIEKIQARYNEKDITKYAALLDWKLLYDKYMEYFGYDAIKRFEIFELIIRQKLIKTKLELENVTDYLIMEMSNISKKFTKLKSKFESANVDTGEVTVSIKGVKANLSYPGFLDS